MRYVEVHWDDELPGFQCLADPYLEVLPSLELPPGALGFVTDPAHYDLDSGRGIKNLEPEQILLASDDPQATVFRYRGNDWTHEASLEIAYLSVVDVRFETTTVTNAGPPGLGAVLLDEILPHDVGCTHELALTKGRILVTCADLVATWRPW